MRGPPLGTGPREPLSHRAAARMHLSRQLERMRRAIREREREFSGAAALERVRQRGPRPEPDRARVVRPTKEEVDVREVGVLEGHLAEEMGAWNESRRRQAEAKDDGRTCTRDGVPMVVTGTSTSWMRCAPGKMAPSAGGDGGEDGVLSVVPLVVLVLDDTETGGDTQVPPV